MEESILKTIKKHLGVYEEDTAFDDEIINDINMAFNVLLQLGVGPEEGYQITGYDDIWEDFLEDDVRLNMVKTYIFRKVQMLFDPPQSGILMEAYKSQIDEMEWRLNTVAEYMDR